MHRTFPVLRWCPDRTLVSLDAFRRFPRVRHGGERRKRMRFLRCAVMATIFLFAGCATREDYQNIVRSWYGADVEALIEAWGPPTDAWDQASGDARILEWAEHRSAGTTYDLVPIGSGFFYPMIARIPSVYCAVRISVTPEGIVDSGIWSGENCTLRPARQ